MDFAHTADDIAFRDELRQWLDDNLPKFLAEWGEQDHSAADPDGSPGAHGIMGAMERRRAWQRDLELATIGWDASPISTARVSMELWSQLKAEDWSLLTDVFPFFSNWPLRLTAMPGTSASGSRR